MKRQEMIEDCTPVKAAPHTSSRESCGEGVRPKIRRGISRKTAYVATLSFQCNPLNRGSLKVRASEDCKVVFQDDCRWLRERHQILTVIDHRSVTVVGELFRGLGVATGEVITCDLDRIRCPDVNSTHTPPRSQHEIHLKIHSLAWTFLKVRPLLRIHTTFSHYITAVHSFLKAFSYFARDKIFPSISITMIFFGDRSGN